MGLRFILNQLWEQVIAESSNGTISLQPELLALSLATETSRSLSVFASLDSPLDQFEASSRVSTQLRLGGHVQLQIESLFNLSEAFGVVLEVHGVD